MDHTQSTSRPILVSKNVRKTYKLGRVDIPVLHGVDLSVERQEWTTILGSSGSGKSTFLHLLGGLDRPDQSGGPAPSIQYDGHNITRFSNRELNLYRSSEVGFVFQFYHLLPELTVLQNVTVGGMIRHGRMGYRSQRAEIEDRAKGLLDRFGLFHRLAHKPSELSGGERQRVAIARSLINEPAVLLADEPTGNLDQKTGESILDAIAEHRSQTGLTLIMVTHDERIASRADRVIRLVDGRVVEDAHTPA